MDSVKIVADRIYNSPFKNIDVDSLNRVFFESNNVRMDIDSSATYQVMFSTETYREPHYDLQGPQSNKQYLAETEFSYIQDSTRSKPAEIKRWYFESRTFSGTELIGKTGIGQSKAFTDSTYKTFPFYMRT